MYQPRSTMNTALWTVQVLWGVFFSLTGFGKVLCYSPASERGRSANVCSKFSMERDSMISNATQRSIFRWIHIIFSIPILGYIYSPFEKLPDYAPATRFVFLPVVLSGLWMWKGHVLRRLISKRSAQQDAAENPSQRTRP